MNQELKEQARGIMCANLIAFEENTPEDKKAELRPKVIFANLDSLIDKTVQMTEERIVGIIKEYPERLLQIMPEGKLHFVVFQGKADEDEKKTIYFQAIKDIISLITNKSDINKDKEKKQYE